VVLLVKLLFSLYKDDNSHGVGATRNGHVEFQQRSLNIIHRQWILTNSAVHSWLALVTLKNRDLGLSLSMAYFVI